MRTLILLLLFALTGFKAPPSSCLKLDVMVAADYSGSVSGYEHFITSAVDAILTSDFLPISEDEIKGGVLIFNDGARIVCPLTGDKQLISDRMRAMWEIGADLSAGTNITVGITAGAKHLLENGRIGVRKVLILISDGMHNVGSASDQPVYLAAQQAQQAGIIICSVVIADNSMNTELMRRVATPGFYAETNYGKLLSTLKQLDLCL